MVGPEPADSALRQRLAVRWILPEARDQLYRLNAWCAAVGPAVVGGWGGHSEGDSGDETGPPPPPPVADSVAMISWNVHVGGGDLRRLIRDLRQGIITGGPVRHFVLMLQEAYRDGPEIPAYDPALPGGSAVTAGPPGGVREDIVRHAENLGLHVYYVPSMRSGEGEDRGNAILSTIPLQDLVAIPLPVARQRRVAIAATLAATTSAGDPWQLHATSLHLESDAEGLASDAAARMAQLEALLDALPEHDAAVVAGDFNTRRRGRDSELVRLMLEEYPDTPAFPPGPTYRRAWGLYRLYLDYMFFRLPDGATARYIRLPDHYNSDHYPLVGWVVFGD